MFFKYFKRKEIFSYEDVNRYVNSLTINSAKKLFLQILNDDIEFKYMIYQYSKGSYEDKGLNQAMNDFFSTFDYVTVSVSVGFDKSIIEQSQYFDDYKIVGGDGFFDVVTGSKESYVYYIDNEAPEGVGLKCKQNSVWHYLLFDLLLCNEELIKNYDIEIKRCKANKNT